MQTDFCNWCGSETNIPSVCNICDESLVRKELAIARLPRNQQPIRKEDLGPSLTRIKIWRQEAIEAMEKTSKRFAAAFLDGLKGDDA